jgi:hypothetical protein
MDSTIMPYSISKLPGDRRSSRCACYQSRATRGAFFLYKGNIILAGRKSPKSLYDPRIATMEWGESSYDQNDATGFIRLNALRLKVRAAMKSSSEEK